MIRRVRVTIAFEIDGARRPLPLTLESYADDNGHWVAEVVELPGCKDHAWTEGEALTGAFARALRILEESRG